jgi:spore germination cell wall hydrolase CwlJ-like protein
MVVSRKRPKGVRYYGPFGLSVLALSLMPRSMGYQDLVALMARQPEVSQRARAHMLASPFGTIHAATFSLPQPIGTLIPAPPMVRLASVGAVDPEIVDAHSRDMTGVPRSIATGAMLHRPRLDFPVVNRRLKGDLLARPRPPQEPSPAAGTRDLTPGRVKTVTFTRPVAVPSAQQAEPPPAATGPAVQADIVSAVSQSKPDAAEVLPPGNDAAPESKPELELKPLEPTLGRRSESRPPPSYVLAALPSSTQVASMGTPLADTVDDSNATIRLGRLYFGGSREGEAVGPIQSWPMEEEPLLETAPVRDPDIKRSALASPQAADFNCVTPSAAPVSPGAKPSDAGESVAAKGEVTGPGRRPKTPAERLGLDAKHRAKSEKCLAEAVYFESRGEPKRGQIAVAQVVMNRVFSGFYPTNVCGVVYQNANRKLACQFTFACDGIPDVVTEPDMWKQAKGIAHDMLDGKLWLPEIGHSTHYHAYWVHPSWVNEMKKLYKIGVHSFYRPRAWGDGSDVPPLNQSQARSADNAAKKAKL